MPVGEVFNTGIFLSNSDPMVTTGFVMPVAVILTILINFEQTFEYTL